MHPNEANKRSNSGFHVKRLLGENASVIPWQRTQQQNMEASCASLGKPPVLLFPENFVSDEAACYEEYQASWQSRPLLIIDATWQQARKMYRQSEWLQSLDVWSLPMAKRDEISRLSGFDYQLRKNQQSTGCSTIETVAFAMHLLGESETADQMLDYFDLFQKDSNDPSQTS